MSARHYLENSAGTLVEVTSRVHVEDWTTKEGAEEGAVTTVQITLVDGAKTLNPMGHRRYRILEDAYDGVDNAVFAGWVAEQYCSKGFGTPYFQPHGRVWKLNLTESNTVWARRLMVGDDANRPAETDVARMQWLLATSEAALFEDVTTFVSTADPVDLEATDYRDQMFNQVADDCAQRSGKNWYAWLRHDGASYKLTAWYGADTLATFASTLSLSNDTADLDDAAILAGTAAVWPISDDTELERKPGRVFSGAGLQFDGGSRYKQREATALAFARRDTTMPTANVKSAAEADARLTRYLESISTQEERITTTVTLPRTRVNRIRPGMLVPFKHADFDDYAAAFVDCRVLSRAVKPVAAGERYELTLVLAGPGPVTTPATVSAILYKAHGPYDANRVYFEQPGDTPPPGHIVIPTSALLTPLVDATPPNSRDTYYGWTVGGTVGGTLDIRFRATTTGVLINNVVHTVTWAILKNGAAVTSVSEVVSGHLEYYAGGQTLTVTGLAVVPGDVITAAVTCTPATMPNFRVPAGTGETDEHLEITGGSLA